jgi:hypothetical protein
VKRFNRPENVRPVCKVEKMSGSYEKWEQGARRKALLGLTGNEGRGPAPAIGVGHGTLLQH